MQSGRFWHVAGVVFAVWMSVAVGRAQDAGTTEDLTVLVARIQAAYASPGGLKIDAWRRKMSSFGGGFAGFGGNGGPQLSSESVLRCEITRRLPGDEWRVIFQEMSRAGGSWGDGRTYVFDRAGSSRAGVTVLNRSTKTPLRIPLPPEIFQQELTDRVGFAWNGDPVVGSQLRLDRFVVGSPSAASPAPTLWGLSGLVRDGEGPAEPAGVVRLKGRGDRRDVVYLWVEEETGLITRQVTLDGGSREFSETLYRNATRLPSEAELSFTGAWPAEGLAQSRAVPKFTPFEDLVAMADQASSVERRVAGPRTEPPVVRPSEPPPPATPDTAATPTSPTAPAVVAAEKSAAPAATSADAGQRLSAEQMEAIVLIEGDAGVGTGFVARLRDRYFVVTNLHVVGGHQSVKVKTIRGKILPVGGFFGARGRDIAILRIEGDYQGPSLKLAEDVFASVKIGDQVTVVGNRRGGGVATQVSGSVQGVGPDRLEVDAQFQPGNSGSPIVHLASGEVIGVASYSQTRELDELDGEAAGPRKAGRDEPMKKTEQRWFGFRADGALEWQAIDLAVWRTQARQIEEFANDSRAIYHLMQGNFEWSQDRPRLRALVERFDSRFTRTGGAGIGAAQEVQEFFRSLRAEADLGVKELKSATFYDFFQTCEYWESSVKAQLETRAELVKGIEQATKNSDAFLQKLRH